MQTTIYVYSLLATCYCVTTCMHKNLYFLGKMCVSTQSKFYTVISNIMANYKRLPSGRDYERVSQAIIQKYPFMKNNITKKVAS